MCLIAVGGAHRDHFLQKKLHDRFKRKLITSTAIAVKSYLGENRPTQRKPGSVKLYFTELRIPLRAQPALLSTRRLFWPSVCVVVSLAVKIMYYMDHNWANVDPVTYWPRLNVISVLFWGQISVTCGHRWLSAIKIWPSWLKQVGW